MNKDIDKLKAVLESMFLVLYPIKLPAQSIASQWC